MSTIYTEEEAQKLYDNTKAKLGWASRNKLPKEVSHWLAELNKARGILRHVKRCIKAGKRVTPYFSQRVAADFETTIDGIPCGVVVESYTPARPWRQHTFPGAGPGDCDPPEYEEIEFYIVDRGGYYAKWLERKMTDDERIKIERMISCGSE